MTLLFWKWCKNQVLANETMKLGIEMIPTNIDYEER